MWGMTGAQIGQAGLSAGGKVLRAFSSLKEGNSQARSLRRQAEEKVRQAGAVREAGIWEGIRFNEDSRRLLSTQRAIFGQAGVTMEGSPEGLMRRTSEELVLERIMRARNTAQEISSLYLEARELKRAAKSAKSAGRLGAFSAFLG